MIINNPTYSPNSSRSPPPEYSPLHTNLCIQPSETSEKLMNITKKRKRSTHKRELFQATLPTTSICTLNTTACQGLREALAFIQKARCHAQLLIHQLQWDRAITVLEKIEQANETIVLRRRKMVLDMANTFTTNEETSHDDYEEDRPRRVRFNTQVLEGNAVKMDRESIEVETVFREELLVLRASANIPLQNYSELWDISEGEPLGDTL